MFDQLPAKRLCAHRGLSAALPENSLPALVSAAALGASEVEFDLRVTADTILTNDWLPMSIALGLR